MPSKPSLAYDKHAEYGVFRVLQAFNRPFVITITMEPETYQKIGRGGAGNYYSKQDIDEATQHAAAEVIKHNTPPPPLSLLISYGENK